MKASQLFQLPAASHTFRDRACICVDTPEHLPLHMATPAVQCRDRCTGQQDCLQSGYRQRPAQTLEVFRAAKIGNSESWVPRNSCGIEMQGGLLSGKYKRILMSHPFVASRNLSLHSTPPVNLHSGSCSQVEPCTQAEVAEGTEKANVTFSPFAMEEAMKSRELRMRWLSVSQTKVKSKTQQFL